MRNYPPIEIIKLPQYRYISRGLCLARRKAISYAEGSTPEISFGRILVEDERGMQGLLDIRGNVVLPCQYDEIDSYTDRFIKISRPRSGETSQRQRNRFGRREVVLAPDDMEEPSIDALRGCEPRYYGILDIWGNTILPCVCTEIIVRSGYKDPKQDRLIYCMDNRWGVCDLAGNEILSPDFDAIEAHILHVASLPYRLAAGLTEGSLAKTMVFLARQGEQWGAYNLNGEEVLPCDKKKIVIIPQCRHSPKAQLFFFLEDGLWTAVDHRGRMPGDEAAYDRAEIPDRSLVLEHSNNTDTLAYRCYGDYGQQPIHQLGGQVFTTVLNEAGESPELRMWFQDCYGNQILEPEYARIVPVGQWLMAVEEHFHRGRDRWRIINSDKQPIFPEELCGFLVTNTGKIVGIPFDFVGMEPLNYLLFYDEATKSVEKLDGFKDIAKFHVAAPYYRISAGSGQPETRFGLADGDGNIVLPAEYERFVDANDCKVELSFFAQKDGEWHLIRICRS